MKKDAYEELMNEYLELDKDERIPLSLSFRLLFSKKCRAHIRLMSKAEKLMSEPLKIQVPLSDASVEAVLCKINPDFNSQKNPIPLSRWIAAGVLMLAFMTFFGILTRGDSAQIMAAPFYLLFAVAVSIYCAFFVGCNMDFFVKKIETMKLAV